MLNVGPPDLLRQMQAAMPGVVQLSLYGLTEGGGPSPTTASTTTSTSGPTLRHALARLEVRIVDPDTGEQQRPATRARS